MDSFEINGWYRNRLYWYKILSIRNDTAKIEFEDGTTRWENDLHILLRIWNNILLEKPYETRQKKRYLENREKHASERALIFTSEKFIEIDDCIYSAGYYHPYRSVDNEPNPKFNKWSSYILDLKNRSEYAIDFFYGELNPRLGKGFPIACVPSHEPGARPSGTVLLAQKLVNNNRIDATSCLGRHKKIQKLSGGGNRSKALHLQTIKVENGHLIRDKVVLLLDDVYTTGNSLHACRQLLSEAGANSVYCLVLGRTVRRA
jgi:hypothetical protein